MDDNAIRQSYGAEALETYAAPLDRLPRKKKSGQVSRQPHRRRSG